MRTLTWIDFFGSAQGSGPPPWPTQAPFGAFEAIGPEGQAGGLQSGPPDLWKLGSASRAFVSSYILFYVCIYIYMHIYI